MSTIKGDANFQPSSQQPQTPQQSQQEMVLLSIGIALLLLSLFALYKIVLWLHSFLLYQINSLAAWWQGKGRKKQRHFHSDNDDEQHNSKGIGNGHEEEDDEEEEIVYVKKRGAGAKKRKKVRYVYE